MSVRRRILGISDSQAVFVPAWKQPDFVDLIRAQTNTPAPNIRYIGAARGHQPDRAADFFKLAERVGCRVTSLDLFAMATGDPLDYFSNADAVFIDGGVTRNLIALLKEWDAVEALIDAYRNGMLIAGASAGISMMFDWCVSDSIKTEIQPVRGIGLLQGTLCAHYDVLEARRQVLDDLIRTTPNTLPAYGLEDGVAVLFEDEVLAETFSIRSNAKLHVLELEEGGIRHAVSSGQRPRASGFVQSVQKGR